jgi:hypothetical protein
MSSIGQCAVYCTSGLPWPSKQPEEEACFFEIVDLLLLIRVATRLCYGKKYDANFYAIDVQDLNILHVLFGQWLVM